MQLKKLGPLVTTNRLSEVKDFYLKHFGFSVSCECEGYLGLTGGGDTELSFMREDQVTPESFEGHGLTLCLEVADVDAEARRLLKEAVPVVVPLKDNPWGDRSIILRDPIGIRVYVYQPKPPSES